MTAPDRTHVLWVGAFVAVMALAAVALSGGATGTVVTDAPGIENASDDAGAGTALATVQNQAGTSDWPMFGADPANTGTIDATGPVTDVTERWNVSTGDDIVVTPAVVDGTVYVGSQNGDVYAVDTADGTIQWQFSTGDQVKSSPAVANGLVYVGSDDGSVYALDAENGTEEWTFSTGGSVQSSPTVTGGNVYVGSENGTVYELDAATGSEEWAFHTGGWVAGAPAVHNGSVYAGSLDGNLYAIDADDGSGRWNSSTGGWVFSGPAVANGTVYAGSDDTNVYAFDTTDGTERWNYTTGSNVESSPTVQDGTVYVTSTDDNLYALDASDGTERWNVSAIQNINAGATLADGVLYFGSDDTRVYGVDADTGTELWRFDAGTSNVRSQPSVANGTVYVGNGDGRLYALEGTGGLSVTADQVTYSVAEGETVTINATVENTGSSEREERVVLETGVTDTTERDARTVTIGPGETRTISLEWDTTGFDPANYDAVVGVEGADAEDVAVIEVQTATPDVSVSLNESVYSAVEGETTTLNATVVNEGTTQREETVRILAPGLLVQETVTLAPGEQTSVTAEWDSSGYDPGTYEANATVAGGLAEDVAVIDVITSGVTVSMNQSTYTVTEDETVVVNATVVNGDGFERQERVSLATGRTDTSVRDDTTVTLAPGEERTVSLEWDTSGYDPADYDAAVTVGGGLAEDVGIIQVETVPDPLVVTANSSVYRTTRGDVVTVDATVENVGAVEWDDRISLATGAASEAKRDEATVSLAPGEQTTVHLEWDTSGFDPGSYGATIAASDASAEDVASIEVETAPVATVSFNESVYTVEEGETTTLDATVRNDGASERAETVRILAPGLLVQETVTLAPGEQTSVTAEWDATGYDPATYEANVTIGDDVPEDVADIEVRSPPDPAYFDPTIVETNSPVAPNGTLRITAEIENTGTANATQELRLFAGDADGGVFSYQNVSLDAGESTTLTMSAEVDSLEYGTYTGQITTENQTTSTTVAVEPPGLADFDVAPRNETVAHGEEVWLEVTDAVDHEGEPFDGRVEMVMDQMPPYAQFRGNVTFTDGEASLMISPDPESFGPGEYPDVEVHRAGYDRINASTTVTVAPPGLFEFDVEPVEDPIEAGDPLELSFTNAVDADGDPIDGDQRLAIELPGENPTVVETVSFEDGTATHLVAAGLVTEDLDAGDYADISVTRFEGASGDATQYSDLTDLPAIGPSRAATLREFGYDTVLDLQWATEQQLAAVPTISASLAADIKDQVGDAGSVDVNTLAGIGPTRADALREAGYETVADVRSATQADLATVEQIDDELAAALKAQVSDDALTDLEDLSGIGPSRAADLQSAGFESIADVQAATTAELAAVSSIDATLAADIKAQVGDGGSADVTTLAGIGSARADALREAGYETVADLRTANLAELAGIDGIDAEFATGLMAAVGTAESGTWLEGVSATYDLTVDGGDDGDVGGVGGGDGGDGPPGPVGGVGELPPVDPEVPEGASIVIGDTTVAESVMVGEAVTVTAELTNDGDTEGTHEVNVSVDGEIVETATVFVGAGENRTVTLAHTLEAEGEYEVLVDGESAGTVVVEAQETASPEATEPDGGSGQGTTTPGGGGPGPAPGAGNPDQPTTEADGPGFGVVVSLLAFVGAGLLARRIH